MALAQAQAERAAARSALENERELRKYYQGNSDVDNPLSYALAVGQLAAARAEVARLTAAAERLLKMHTRPDGSTGSDTSMVEGALMDLRAAMRQPAPAQQISTSDGVTWHTFGGNTPPEQVAKPAPAGGEVRP